MLGVQKVTSSNLVRPTSLAHFSARFADPDKDYPHPERSEAGAFSAVLKRAGVVGRRFHDFRHTFASRLADAGVGTEVIKRLGGWNVTATALRYQHSERLGELREAIRAVEENG